VAERAIGTNVNNNISVEAHYYPETLLQAWKNGNYAMLRQSRASQFIKKIVTEKAKVRQHRHIAGLPMKQCADFFGEAFIASQIEPDMIDGWYNSYKWLNSDRWLTGKGLKPGHQQQFYGDALMGYIGSEGLRKLQEHAAQYEKVTGICPVPPDLWIITKQGGRRVFKFIESKLPGDHIADSQILGLMLISNYLNPAKPATVTASVMCLGSEEQREEKTFLQVKKAIRDFIEKGYDPAQCQVK
jgi:hypothetical protein